MNLELVVSQQKIVRLGQLSCLILVLILVLRELPNYIAKLGTLTFEREEKFHQKQITDHHFDFYYSFRPETSQEAILEEIEDRHQFRTEQLKMRYQRLFFLFGAVNVGIVDILFPIALGLLVFFDPYFVELKISDEPIQFLIDTSFFEQTAKKFHDPSFAIVD